MDLRKKLIELMIEAKKADTEEAPRSEFLADFMLAKGVMVQGWVPVTERLPEEKEYVLIWCGECQVARIEKGITEEQREAMKRGELDDPCVTGWTLSSGYFTLKRSQSYEACDQQGNNKVPYCWYSNGPMQWFGQEVTHWMPLPQPPKGD